MSELLTNLIVVPGHAAFKDSINEVPADPENDEHWVLQEFQHGEPPYYIEHIRAGVELAAKDPASLLLFSGGHTRHEAGKWSEAATYRALAEHYEYWHAGNTMTERTNLEEFARDSFENLTCSLYRFYQLVGRYPTRISVVGWKFKQPRFEFHAQTLGISDNFTYIGCNNPVPADLAAAEKGEARTLEQFRADPRGEHSPLSDKRQERNPFSQQNPYVSCPPINLEV